MPVDERELNMSSMKYSGEGVGNVWIGVKVVWDGLRVWSNHRLYLRLDGWSLVGFSLLGVWLNLEIVIGLGSVNVFVLVSVDCIGVFWLPDLGEMNDWDGNGLEDGGSMMWDILIVWWIGEWINEWMN